MTVASKLAAVALALATSSQVSAQDDTTLARIRDKVERPEAMCGTFDQQRTLVGLSRPVRSSGRFCFVAARGIVWRTLKPFESTLKLTRDAIEESAGGRVTSRMSGKDEPAITMISELLFSVLAGDLQQLRRAFAVEARVEGDGWKAHLVPKDAAMRTAVGAIVLSGAAFVRTITISLDAGDRTEIGFTGVATGLSALLPPEAELLGVKPPPR